MSAGLFEIDTRTITVSAASANQLFHGCEPQYINDVCHGRCCRSSTEPRGILVTIHRTETEAREAMLMMGGGVDADGLVIPRAGEKQCPAQQPNYLCHLHGTPAKPFGCIASPFTLTSGDRLVVRNRYRLLRCYRQERRAEWGDPGGDGPALPAYVAFRASLDLILGYDEAVRCVAHLEAGGGDYVCPIPLGTYTMLHDNDNVKRRVHDTHKEEHDDRG